MRVRVRGGYCGQVKRTETSRPGVSEEDAARGRRIRDARKARGLTQEVLARMVPVDRSTLAHWETGDARPDGVNLLALAHALEMSAERLFGTSGPGRQEIDARPHNNPHLLDPHREGTVPVPAEEHLSARVEMLGATCRDLLVRMVRAEDELIRARGAAGGGRDAAPRQA